MSNRTSPAHSPEALDYLGDYADLDPAILASLRTSADEDALAAAVETQLAISAAQNRQLAPVVPLRRSARTPHAEQRAA